MFFWNMDTKKNEKLNDGYNERSDYLGAADGQFNATILVKHIFGFDENYDKVINLVKHDLTLRRGDDANALFKASDKYPNNQCKVADEQDYYQKTIITQPRFVTLLAVTHRVTDRRIKTIKHETFIKLRQS